MKLKESRNLSFYNKLPLIFFLCSFATIVIRTVQLFVSVDRETGFYNGGSFLTVVLYSIIAAASVLFAVTSYACKKTESVDLKIKKDTSLGLLTVILSLAFLYDSVSALFGAAFSENEVTYGVSAFQSMMLSGTIPQLFQGVFAVLSAVYFLTFAKGVIKGCETASKHSILAVAPVGWAGFRLIHRFVEQISYIRVSELLLELIFLALAVMFFMAFAQTASGVYVKNARWRIIGIGMPAALVSLTLNFPRLVFVLLSGTDTLYLKYPFRVCDFVLALFIAVVAVKIISRKSDA